MKKLLLAAVAALALAGPSIASADVRPVMENLAIIAADLMLYEQVCGGHVSASTWEFILKEAAPYGKANAAAKQAMRDEIASKQAARAKAGDGKFCMALTSAVNAVETEINN
jgi:hypothetical protein